MAEEELGQERTEAPSPRRREEARRQGLIAVSADLNTGVHLLVAAIALSVGAETLGGGLLEVIRGPLASPCGTDLDPKSAQLLLTGTFALVMKSVGFLLAALAASGLAHGLIQGGFAFYPDILSIKWERLDPSQGLKRLFSWASGVRLLTSLLKVTIMVVLAYVFLRGRLGIITRLGEGTPAAAIAVGWDLVSRLFLSVALALLFVGLLDYLIQRVRVERQMRVTRQEAKLDLKQDEGDPLIKARIRRLQREAAQRRMMEAVPRATVVITNPTHLAVALRYDRASMSAPRIVALGSGWLAERILERARQHAVPIVENRPLAQALYRSGKIDQEIPEALYQAVAELLAFVYRMRGLV